MNVWEDVIWTVINTFVPVLGVLGNFAMASWPILMRSALFMLDAIYPWAEIQGLDRAPLKGT